MTKGLTRSLSRGNPVTQKVVKQVISFKDIEVAVSATSSAVGYGSAVIAGLPEGNILYLGAVSYVKISGSGTDTNLADDFEGDFSIGTTPVGATTFSGGNTNISDSTPLAAASGEEGTRTKDSRSTVTVFDNTDGSLEINLNVLIDAADITDDETVTLTAEGELHLIYSVLGDD